MYVNKKIIVALVVIIALGVGVWAYFAAQPNASAPRDSNTATDQPAGSSQTNTPSGETPTSGTEIVYTDAGFSPKSLTVKAGTTIKVMNKSSGPLEFSSADHPTHTKNAEFNLATLQPGQEEAFEVKTAGTWGYHNHLKANDTGIVVVQG